MNPLEAHVRQKCIDAIRETCALLNHEMVDYMLEERTEILKETKRYTFSYTLPFNRLMLSYTQEVFIKELRQYK